MTYFHTDSDRTLTWLENVIAQARDNNRRLRFSIESDGGLKVKVGEGMWTAPIASTPDPYRDTTANKPVNSDGDAQQFPEVFTMTGGELLIELESMGVDSYLVNRAMEGGTKMIRALYIYVLVEAGNA